ncbi:MAG TPA: TonB-dependent receptor [Candidatus Aquilonibacter sp.]|nr:TonB-dependent receptor [Candidatus Aquilonibacter sp.]
MNRMFSFFQGQAGRLIHNSSIVISGVLVVLALCSVRAHAQGYGTIVGTVTDPTGAVVPNVSVLATAPQTGQQTTAVTNARGEFTFPTLLPRQYTISVTASGFKAYKRSGILLQANQAQTLNITLAIGSETQTVTVSSTPPQVNTTNPTLSQVIGGASVVDLPLNGRNAASLITLVSGVASASNEGNGADQGTSKTFPAAVISSSNGTLPNQENFLLDGGNNVDEQTNVNDPFPFPDALQEFSVQTTNYDAEFGQSAGAVVNIVTKSGTNQFHGDAFEFLRNGFFDARPYFATSADTLHRNQFGGVIGGPLIIPHLSKGKTTQFFVGWQRTISHSASTGHTSTVPTLAEEGRASGESYADYGNLCNSSSGHSFNSSGICVNSTGAAVPAEQIRNPFTNQVYPYNRIPSSDFDQAAVAFEKVFPTYSGTEAPGKIGGTVNYYLPSIQTFNEFVGRIDHQFGDSDHLFGRYYYNFFNAPGYYDSSNLLEYSSFANTRYQNALLSETHTFSPTVVNNLVANYQREYTLRGGPPGSPLITAFGVGNIWQPSTGPFIQASISGYFQAVATANAVFGRNDYNFDDVLHWVKGSHSFAFGGHFELSKYDATNVYTSYGSFAFNSATNTVAGTTYNYPNAMANFQLGFMTGFGQGNYEAVNNRGHFPAIFAQDNWRVTHRLVLDYGVRWELFAPWADRLNKQTYFNPANYAANIKTSQYTTLPAGMVLSGDPDYPQNGINDAYTHFMPRVGFAYDVFGNSKTSVRGGFGVFYQDRLQAWMNLTQSTFVPNTISVSLTNLGMYSSTPGANPGGPFSNPYCTGCSVGSVPNPFPFTKPFPSTQVFPNAFQVAEFDPNNFHAPVTYGYNLTFEQQLTSSMSMRLAYVASGSRHQLVNLELNPAVNNGSGLSTNQRRVYNTAPTVGPCATAAGCQTSYSDITEGSTSGSTNYNSLQASLQKKMAHGLSMLANFTWSHSLGDMPLSRLSNTEDVNVDQSYVYPIYPANATGIPAAARVSNIKALDIGNSDIDHPIIFSLSYVYALPKLREGSRVLRAFSNGWMTSGIVSHQSGDALTAYMGTDNSLTGVAQDRAQEDFSMSAYKRGAGLGDCSPGKSCVNWLNPSAFSVPVQNGPGTGFGNVVKGSLRGPGLTNWDGAVMRSFPVYRETILEFRAEYFDLLNHTELSNPSTSNPSSTSFGTITSTQGGPRIAQFSLKYTF